MADWRITTVPTSVEFAASRCTESFRQGLASQYLNDQLHRALQDQSDRFNIWSGEVTANAKAFTAFNASIAEDENTAGLLIILLERLDRQVKALISADADETRSSLLGAGLEELSYDSNPSSESSISGLSDDEVQASWPRFQTDGLEIEAMSKTLNQLYRFITSTTKSLALEASARIDRFIKEQKAEHEVDELCLLTEWRMHQNLRTITVRVAFYFSSSYYFFSLAISTTALSLCMIGPLKWSEMKCETGRGKLVQDVQRIFYPVITLG